MIVCYGAVNAFGVHMDTAKTERGAKCWATLNGYSNISARWSSGHAQIISRKAGGKWVNA